jgi:alpha-2-macroglobulin
MSLAFGDLSKGQVTPAPESGRVRIALRDARTGRGVPGAQVKVIGSRSPAAQVGETDLRGVFIADAVDGRLTVVARSGTARYAIYRSPAEDHHERKPASARGRARVPVPSDSDSRSGDDLRTFRRQGRERQSQRLQRRGGMGGTGGGFR